MTINKCQLRQLITKIEHSGRKHETSVKYNSCWRYGGARGILSGA